MELGNWDDDDFETPGAGPANGEAQLDDLFEFSTSLRIFDDEDQSPIPAAEQPALEPGVTDLTGDRGVLLRLKTAQAAAAAAGDDASSPDASTRTAAATPSKEEPFVELHYEAFLEATGDKFDSSREQNYAMIVQLDIPPSGKSSVIRGLEIALRELRAGDEASVLIAARYAYGKDGAPDIPPDSDLRFEIEVLDVRATHKRVVKTDHSVADLSRLEDVRRQREIAQQRREEEKVLKDEEKKKKADRAAALKEKLANKGAKKGGKKGGKKKK